MKKALTAGAVALAILLATLPVLPANASPWNWRHSHETTQPTSPPAHHEMSGLQRANLQSLLDQIALTDIELSPFGRMIVNTFLKFLLPPLCPVLADAADPAFSDLVLQGCQGVASSPDPYAALLDFLPLACGLGDTIFPDYKVLLSVVCDLLY